MTSPRWRRARKIGLVALIAPILWALIVLAAPMDWARRRIVAHLEARSGRRVELEAVSLGLLGGVHLTGLRIGSAADLSDPWLKSGDIRLDFGISRMITGEWRPNRIEVDGLDLRVLRRADGKLELADLLRPIGPRIGRDGLPAPEDAQMALRLHRANFAVIDEPSRTRIEGREIEGIGYTVGRLFVVEQLRGAVNGGEIRFSARIDRTASNLAAEARVRVEGVGIDGNLGVLRYAVPVLSGATEGATGRLGADLLVRGQGTTWPALVKKLRGRGELSLKQVSIDRTPLMSQLSRFVDLGARRRVGTIQTTFGYRNGRISTDRLTLNVGRVPVAMSGWTDLDGRIDYRLRIVGLENQLPDQARRLLGELKVDLGSMTTLTLQGTLDQMVVAVNGKEIDAKHGRDPLRNLPANERERLRLLGRQLRDGLLR